MRTDPLSQLLSRKQAVGFNDGPLPMDPLWLDGIKPGAFCRESEGQDTHACAGLFDLLIVFSDLREKDVLLNTSIPSQTMVRKILTDLEQQQFIEKRGSNYTSLLQFGQVDTSLSNKVQQQKLNELQIMIEYAESDICHMEYLTSYLGDESGSPCGFCSNCTTITFPLVSPSKDVQQAAKQFFEEDFLPHIETRGNPGKKHESGWGWSLSYHGESRIGKLVRHSKYENGGPFAEELIELAVKVIRKHYPLTLIDTITSMPPTKSGKLVETFAQNIANVLSITYVLALVKVRKTKEQKDFVNKVQKEHNIKDAFAVASPQLIVGRTILLIDDIYDSGYTFRAATKVLMEAGALAVYPFTITRTLHSDDQ